LLVKVTTDQGWEGWGETFGFRAVTSAKLAIDELIAPLCVGQDATQIAPATHIRPKRTFDAWYLAVDIALWDIACKAANAPVHRLLGSGDADLVRYASLVSYSDASIVRASVRRAIDDGFSSLKLHEIKLSAIHAAREEAGAEVELMLDVN
jgi:L-alanine-DL-glutamate epimerase-like enolase superfamily enzyme